MLKVQLALLAHQDRHLAPGPSAKNAHLSDQVAGQEPGQHPYTVRGEVSATAAHILPKLTTSVLSSGLTRRSSPRKRRSEVSPRSRRLAASRPAMQTHVTRLWTQESRWQQWIRTRSSPRLVPSSRDIKNEAKRCFRNVHERQCVS